MQFRAAVPMQARRLDCSAHAGAGPVGFDREPRLLCAFLVWCYEPMQPRSKKKGQPGLPRPSKWPRAYGVCTAGREPSSTKQSAMVMKGVTATHITENGSESLLLCYWWKKVEKFSS